ncbi:hypothetical protein HDU98_008758 [Podochytrium sp. JEL0797]|nr:hypothetical protein HDU98_008758 [Podochytrium sp. JEL0797]
MTCEKALSWMMQEVFQRFGLTVRLCFDCSSMTSNQARALYDKFHIHITVLSPHNHKALGPGERRHTPVIAGLAKRALVVGDKVLWESNVMDQFHRKMKDCWSGPFVIVEVREGTYILLELSGKLRRRPETGDRLILWVLPVVFKMDALFFDNKIRFSRLFFQARWRIRSSLFKI